MPPLFRALAMSAALAAAPALAFAADQPQAAAKAAPSSQAGAQWQGCPGHGQGRRDMMGAGRGMMNGQRGQGMMAGQNGARMRRHMRGQNMPCQQAGQAQDQSTPQAPPKSGTPGGQ